MPMDYVQGVPTALLDVARYGLLGLTVVSTRSERPSVVPRWALGALLVYGVMVVASGVTTPSAETATKGVTVLVAAACAYLLSQRPSVHASFLRGFLIGVLATSLDLVSQALGGPYLGTPSEHGLRFSGFSATSTGVSPLLAMGFILLLEGSPWRRRAPGDVLRCVARLTCLVLITAALFLSNGRGGIAGLACAGLIWVVLRLRSHPLVVATLTAAALAGAYAAREPLLRVLLRDDTTAELGNGRDLLNTRALYAFLDEPLLGVSNASLSSVLNPHTPLLTFAVEVGITGLAVASFLVALQVAAVLSATSGQRRAVVAKMGISVMLVISFLEPDGFFVGLARCTLFFIALTYIWPTSRGASDGAGTTAAHRRPLGAGSSGDAHLLVRS